jgi:type IV secretory pathway TrbD component
VATPKAKRARKRRNPEAAPRAVASTRRQERVARVSATADVQRRSSRRLGAEGERPSGLFGGVPVSEVAILAGIVAAAVGFFERSTLPLVVGLIVCGLGVMEVVGREHFSGFRSHTAMLAAIPAVGVEAGVAVLAGHSPGRGPLLAIVVPVFGVFFWLFRRQFAIARQARVSRSARGVV